MGFEHVPFVFLITGIRKYDLNVSRFNSIYNLKRMVTWAVVHSKAVTWAVFRLKAVNPWLLVHCYCSMGESSKLPKS